MPRYQILLLGDPEVGKTAVLNRAVNDKFSDHYLPTRAGEPNPSWALLGPFAPPIESSSEDRSNDVFLEVLDLDFPSQIASTVFHASGLPDGALVVFDRNSRASFERVATWVNGIHDLCERAISDQHRHDEQRARPLTILALGNKSDLLAGSEKSDVDFESARKILASELGIRCLEGSAKWGINVLESFRSLATAVARRSLALPVGEELRAVEEALDREEERKMLLDPSEQPPPTVEVTSTVGGSEGSGVLNAGFNYGCRLDLRPLAGSVGRLLRRNQLLLQRREQRLRLLEERQQVGRGPMAMDLGEVVAGRASTGGKRKTPWILERWIESDRKSTESTEKNPPDLLRVDFQLSGAMV